MHVMAMVPQPVNLAGAWPLIACRALNEPRATDPKRQLQTRGVQFLRHVNNYSGCKTTIPQCGQVPALNEYQQILYVASYIPATLQHE